MKSIVSELMKPYRYDTTERLGHRTGPQIVMRCTPDVPLCMGMAARDECTCPIPLTKEEHDRCVSAAREAANERQGTPCDDCAFRHGSPESDDGMTWSIVEQPGRFHCHQGMPFVKIAEPDGVSYVPDDRNRYPVCNGWRALKALDHEDRIDAFTAKEPPDDRP